MSMPQSAVFTAIAFQLAAALETYEQDLDRLLAAPKDLELYQRMSQRMDDMRMFAASLPEVSVAWVEVLIGHFELTHCLWRMAGGQNDACELEQLRERHKAVIKALHHRALRLVGSTNVAG